MQKVGDPPLGIVQGDCRVVLKDYPDNFFHAVVCDPPYFLEFMGEDWDKLGRQAGAGFNAMQSWHMAWAIEAFRVLKPGGHLVAFGGTRTHHRLMCALEDAGFDIRDTLMWLYGSGLPKSRDIGKAIDKQAGAAREVVGPGPYADRMRNTNNQVYGKGTPSGQEVISAPATAEARAWDGWGTALKPSYEPIILARKPLSELTVAANVLRWGTGAINVDGCRVEHVTVDGGNLALNPHLRKEIHGGRGGYILSTEEKQRSSVPTPAGRWPANLILQHSDACVPLGTKMVRGGHWTHKREIGGHGIYGGGGRTEEDFGTKPDMIQAWDCVPDCPVRLLDGQSGELTSGAMKRDVGGYAGNGMFVQGRSGPGNQHGDSGGASRFFYTPKADTGERWFWCGQCKVHSNDRDRHGTPGWDLKDGPDPHWAQVVFHPTQKPIEVMRWLVRLVTPPGGIVLDPFVGSGTTAVAAEAEGCMVLGIDQDETYCGIARHRMLTGVAKKPKSASNNAPDPVLGKPHPRARHLF